MITGFAAMVVVVISLIHDAAQGNGAGAMESHALTITAAALAVAAALELSYTLFTDGPDEAIDPLMLGISAALLYLVSTLTSLTWTAGLALALFAGTLALLFAVRRRFISNAGVRELQQYRRVSRQPQAAQVMGGGQAASAALDLLELLEFAWHDCHGETHPPDDVSASVLTLSQGDLAEMIRLARLAVEDQPGLLAAAAIPPAGEADATV